MFESNQQAQPLDSNDPFAAPQEGSVPLEQASPTGSRPKASKTTIAMVAMFVAGVAIVVALSGGTSPHEASASDQQVEARVEAFLTHSHQKEAPNHTDSSKLIASFYHYASRRQIPVSELQANPFVRSQNPAATRIAQTANPTGKTGNSQKRKQLKREFAKLVLKAAMASSRGGTAIINDKFLVPGQRIGSFTVKAITPGQVELECDQITFTLKLNRQTR